MNISRIRLKQFRNIQEQTVSLNSGLNIFHGSNGQGKTNLMEAVYLLTHGVSFRTSDLQVLVNKNDFYGFYLESEIFKGGICHQIEMMVSGRKKSLTINKKKTTLSKLRKTFCSILFSPESLQLIKDSDKKRRELIDDLCLSLFSGFSDLYSDCQRLLKQKNSLLKKIRERQISIHAGEELNQQISFQFFEKSSQLCVFRLEAIKEVKALLPEKFFCITGDYDENISMEYLISNRVFKFMEKEEFFNAMYKEWVFLKEREKAVGQCLVGPHKHSIKFKFNEKNARFFCSQGQQRAIVLAFKMVQTELYYKAHEEFPILLLDDVLSELDSKKRVNFLKELVLIRGQVFLTTTDEAFNKKGKRSFVFEVKGGSFYKKENFPERGEPDA